MADFKTALQALARNEIKLEALVKNMDKLLRKQPALAQQMLGELRDAYANDVIDARTYASLKKRVQDVAGAGVEAGGNADERTRVAAGDGDERTQFAPADDRTQVLSDADMAAIAEEARASTRIDITTGETTGGIDFDLSTPSTGSGSWTGTATGAGASTGTGATGTGWAQPGRPPAAESVKLGPGSVLKERFQLLEVLGVGGMGTVYKGIDKIKEEARDKNPYVALKVLNEDFKQHPDAFIALQREASRQQKLAHPNIATVYDFDRIGGTGSTVFIVMELMEGTPLNNYIKKTVKSRNGLPFAEAWPIIQGLGHGLVYAHERKMVHSDFKPGNCFLIKDGSVKILDFGIARAVKNPLQGDAEKTLFDPGKLGALTPAYASAEMLEGLDPDPRDDIYALACVAYELLTGRHPFNKVPANSARENKLVPAPIKGLKRRQLKGLLRGLAFNREDRSQNVQQFLEELEGTSTWYKNPFVIGGALLVVAAVAGTPQMISYMHRKTIDAAVADINSGDAARIVAVLDQLPTLKPNEKTKFDADDQKRILDDAREKIQAYFQNQIADHTAKGSWAEAQSALARFTSLYPDSSTVKETTDKFDEARSTAENQLSARYNRILEEGRLLPDEGADDLGDVLTAIQKFDPRNPLLGSPRVSNAFLTQAEQALASGDFELAQKLVDTGKGVVAHFAGAKKQDIYLANLGDKVRNLRDRAEQDRLIAGAEQTIRAQQSALKALPSFAAVADAVVQLAAIAPANALLGEVSGALKPVLAAEVSRIRRDQDWGAVDPLFVDYKPMLTALRADAELPALDEERRDYNQKADGYLLKIAAALGQGRIAGAGAENAVAIADELARTLPGSTRASQARDMIARAYLRQARIARAGDDYAKARAQLDAALARKPGPDVQQALAAESNIISRMEKLPAADRDRMKAEQKSEAASAAAEVDKLLAQMEPTRRSAAAVLAAVDRLEALDPLAPKVGTTRADVGARLAAAADKAGTTGNWDVAVVSMRDALAYMPESDKLAATLEKLQQGAKTALAEAQKRIIAEGKQKIAELMAKKTFDHNWDLALTNEFARVQPLVPDTDPWLAQTRRELGAMYLGRAAQMREEQRYEEAGSLIAKAERYAADLPAFSTEKGALAAAQAEFEKARQAELQKAEIDSLKQSLVSQAKAKDVSNATKALEKLRALLPADDAFLTTEIPQLLGDAYLKTADARAAKNDFLAALKVAREGLTVAPNHPGLKKAVQKYTVDGDAAELNQIFGGDFTEIDVARVGALLKEVDQVNSTRGAELNAALEKKAADRIRALAATQPAIAKDLLAQAKQAFPGSTVLAAVKLEDIAPKAPCKSCGLANEAMKSGRLTRARELIDAARRDPAEKDHPDLQRAENNLNKRVDQANTALAEYQAFQKELAARTRLTREELDQASSLLGNAEDGWSDRKDFDYKGQRAWIDAELAKLRTSGRAGEAGGPRPGKVTRKGAVTPFAGTSPQPCSEGLAGYGERKKGQCFAWVDSDKRGPMMVVVPAGGNVQKAFAISKYEVTYYDYNRFCEVSGWCTPFNVRKEDAPLPVTGISVDDARAYTEWLSRRTGTAYRLPTDDEWSYAATADGKAVKKDYNCRVEQAGQVLKGQSVMPVNTGTPNGWGLYNYVGNVQEWATTGSGVVARGGAYQDNFSKCETAMERPHDGNPDTVTGFRVVREMN
ncbi:MAG: protein kinase [Gammaproteobacteria bacterium]